MFSNLALQVFFIYYYRLNSWWSVGLEFWEMLKCCLIQFFFSPPYQLSLLGYLQCNNQSRTRRPARNTHSLHTYTHTFCCLGRKDTSTVPSRVGKDQLQRSGVGDKRLVFRGLSSDKMYLKTGHRWDMWFRHRSLPECNVKNNYKTKLTCLYRQSRQFIRVHGVHSLFLPKAERCRWFWVT